MRVQVQAAGFDAGELINRLYGNNPGVGAVACLIGYLRDFNQGQPISAMYLEHYPGMTEKALQRIAEQAFQRWPLLGLDIVHRVGNLTPTEPIVFVGAASAHRAEALAACSFVMDYLKTQAPLWKKEQTPQGAHWVEGRASDRQAAARWNNEGPDRAP